MYREWYVKKERNLPPVDKLGDGGGWKYDNVQEDQKQNHNRKKGKMREREREWGKKSETRTMKAKRKIVKKGEPQHIREGKKESYNNEGEEKKREPQQRVRRKKKGHNREGGEKEKKKRESQHRGGRGLVWFYGISTIVGYLMPNPFVYIQIALFLTIHFSISTQFKCKKK